jgi:hypothetical protein
MVRSCLLALLLYAASAVGYYFWLATVFDPPEVYWASAGLGFVVFCCLGALINARTAWRDWSLAAAARANAPPRDGRLMAACGAIQPVSEPLLAPFSNVRCCLCEYELSQDSQQPLHSNDDAKKGSDLAGFLMTPSEIHTQSGKIKVLGFPVLEEERKTTLSSFTAARRARDFVSRTQFEDISGLRLLNAFGAIQDAWTDEDGRVEKNLQLKKVDPQKLFPDDLEAAWQQIHREMPSADEDDEEELEDDDLDADSEDDDDDLDEDDSSESLSAVQLPTLIENRIEAGDKVCVIGKYDEMQRGIRPTGAGMQALRLIRGDVATLEKKSRSSLSSHLLGGIFFLIVAHAVTYGAMMLFLYSGSNIRKREQDAFSAAEKGDVKKLARLEQQKLILDVQDSDGQTLLMRAKDPKTVAWLIDHKVNVNAIDKYGESALGHAARGNRPDIVKQLIAAGANLNLRNKSQSSPLLSADQGGHEEVAEILRAAGAEDDVITAKTGEPLAADGGPQLAAIKAYQQAIQERNAEQLAAVMTDELQKDIDPDLWASFNFGIVREVQAFEGFTKGDAATVMVFGTWGEKREGTARATYQLRRVDGQWKVARKRIEIN